MAQDRDGDPGGTMNGIEVLFRKYARIWIWSIIFGLDTTLSLTFSTQSFARYNLQVSLILAVPLLASAAALVVSWFALSQFLTRSLLPLLKESAVEDETDHVIEDEIRLAIVSDAAKARDLRLRLLNLAVEYAIVAIILRVVGFGLEAIFGSLGKF